MSDSTSEILIAIKTALDAGGLDAAKQKLGELTKAQEEQKGASAGSSLELSKLQGELSKLARAGQLASLAMQGNARAGMDLARVLGSSGLAGSVLPAVGVFTAFYQIGRKLAEGDLQRQWEADAKAVSELARRVEEVQDQTRALAEVDLSGFRASISGIASGLATELERLEKTYARVQALAQADDAAEKERLKREDSPEARLRAADIDLVSAEREYDQTVLRKEKELQTVTEDIDARAQQRQDAQQELVAAQQTAREAIVLASQKATKKTSVVDEVTGQTYEYEVEDVQENTRRAEAAARAKGDASTARTKLAALDEEIGKANYMQQLESLKAEVKDLKENRDRSLAPAREVLKTAQAQYDADQTAEANAAIEESNERARSDRLARLEEGRSDRETELKRLRKRAAGVDGGAEAFSAAEEESGEAFEANRNLNEFRRTGRYGGQQYRGQGFREKLAELQQVREQEEAEANAALSKLGSLGDGLSSTLLSILQAVNKLEGEISQVKSQAKNSRTD